MFQVSFVVIEAGGKLSVGYVGTDAQAAEKTYEAERLKPGNKVVAFFQTPSPRLTAYPASEAAAAKAALKAKQDQEEAALEADKANIAARLDTARKALEQATEAAKAAGLDTEAEAKAEAKEKPAPAK